MHSVLVAPQDHIFASASLARRSDVEIIHANTWASEADAVSDHDPVLGKFTIC